MARRRFAGSVASVALVVIAVVLAIVGDQGDSSDNSGDTRPHLVDVADLIALEETLGHPIYWVAERPPARLELKQEPDGSVFLRYLPPMAKVGRAPAAFLTIGTYPVPDAQETTRRAAADLGARVGPVANGGLTFENQSRTSAYLAYPDSDLQIEVYDLKPGRALELVRGGSVEPVGD